LNGLEQIFNFRLFAPKFLKIKNEVGQIVPLAFNYAQLKVLEVIERLQAEGKPIRIIVLKARQVGISTLIQGWICHFLITNLNQRCLTMGHKVDASNNLFDMFKRYYDNLPKELQPVIEKSNEKKVSFRKLKSENKVDTAGAGEVGRSDTLQLLHATEVAFYPDANLTMLGLMQGAKNAQMICLESTANGISGLFYNDWVSAINGDSDYVPIFISWLEVPEYTKKFDNEEQREKLQNDLGNGLFNSFEGEEQTLIDMGATLEKLNWRRWVIKNLCQNDVSRFHQEYPSTWEEAFVSSGSPVFPAHICQRRRKETLELERKGLQPLKRGDLIVQYDKEMLKALREQGKTSYEDLRFAIDKVEFVENSRGFIQIWKDLKKGGVYRYAGGVDVAEGLAQGDRSEIRVMDREDSEIALTWSGHIDPDLLGEEIHKIWFFLNKDVHFAIEKNNHGLTTIMKCFKLGVNLYYKQGFNQGYETQSHEVGFSTNIKTKPIMINELNEWIREGLFTDNDPDFWNQTLTFVKNARGQMQAEGKDSDPNVKCFDDKIIAEGLTVMCSQWLSNFRPEKDIPRYARSYVLKNNKPKGVTKF